MSAWTEEKTLIGGLSFPEEPRWRDGLLWFIDVGTQLILAVDETGRELHRIELDFSPGGLGWLPDSTILVVDVGGCRVMAIEGDNRTPKVYADLRGFARLRPNGMCVSRSGAAFVASIGSELNATSPRASGNIIRLRPEQSPEILFDEDIRFPNGISLSRDETRLCVPETFGERVSIFDVSGSEGKRVIAAAPGMWPDGSCSSVDDSFWFADAGSVRCARASHAGVLVEELSFSRRCYAPVLNATGDRLFVAVADDHGPKARARNNAAIVWRTVSARG